jgi:hypothetical protein
MLRRRHLARSNRRRCDSVSYSSESRRTVPSSQPRARSVDAGLTAKDQMAPPWELMDRCRKCSAAVTHLLRAYYTQDEDIP